MLLFNTSDRSIPKLELELSLCGNHGAKAPNRRFLTRACREHVLYILKELTLMTASSCVVFACASGEIKQLV